MGVPIAAGAPNIEAQGLNPTLFAKDFNVRYYEGSIIPRTAGSKLCTELISKGQKIIIPSLPTINFPEYTRHGVVTPEQVTSVPLEVTINRSRSFCIPIDPVDVKQSHIAFQGKYMDTAMKQWDEKLNGEYLPSVYTGAHASNCGATAGVIDGGVQLGTASVPLSFTKTDAVDILTRATQVIGEQKGLNNKENMWCVIPWAIRQRIVNSDLKAAFVTGDPSSVMRTGSIGKLDGVMETMTSNHVHSAIVGGKRAYFCPFGTMDAIAFVQQLQHVSILEGDKNSNSFETLLRGLFVYDWAVVKPEALGYFVLTAG